MATDLLVSMASTPRTVRDVITLFPLSFDAGVTLWLLRKFGHKIYPGIRQAKLLFWEGSNPPDGRQIEEWEEEGHLPINCGKGTLDHHPHGSFSEDCSFTLALKKLGLIDDPRFNLLKRFTFWDDTRRGPDLVGDDKVVLAYALPRLFKDMQAGYMPIGQYAIDLESMRAIASHALKWLYCALNSHFKTQEVFHSEAKEAHTTARVLTISDKSSRRWRVAFNRTDCPQWANYARWKNGRHPIDLVIQGRHLKTAPEGVSNRDLCNEKWPIHIQISASNRSELDLQGLAYLLRLEEMKHCRITMTQPLESYYYEGTHLDVPQWHFMPGVGEDSASFLQNGSPGHRSIVPTAIYFERVIRIVKDWLASQETIPESMDSWCPVI